METKFKSGKWYFFPVLFFFAFNSAAQYCDPITPVFNVDLSASPNMTWVSPLTGRDGYCCGASGADNCLEFVITLHPNSASVVFNIASGAVPPGALYYQIDCGPATPVGSPICLTGVGPFHLTFCKPGNNSNTFSIVTIPNPIFGPDLSLGDGCNGMLWAQFYDESSVNWTSLTPGAPGAYNSLLSCTSGCDTTFVNPGAVNPPVVQYQVCGLAQNGCIVDPVCDTMTVTFDPPLVVNINAPDTVLCSNELTVPASATVTGGTAPYTINWSNGASGSTANLGPGTHTVSVTDANNCVIRTDVVTVTQLPLPIVNAGPDQVVCADNQGIMSLSGTFSNTTGILWSGGSGTFLPNTATANATYTPSAADIAAGSTTLTITSNDASGCPQVSDNMTITFQSIAQNVSVVTTPVTCNGLANGSATVTVTGPNGPYTYSFDGGAATPANTSAGLAAGVHNVAVISAIGCDTVVSFTITEPALLAVTPAGQTNVTCPGGNDGTATITVAGGTTPYAIAWNTTPAQTAATATGLYAGNYTATVTDANGCVANAAFTITVPPAYTIAIATVPVSCNGLANGSATVTVSGGPVGPYTYSFDGGAATASNTGNGLLAGNHTVNITNANGCDTVIAFTITEPALLVATAAGQTNVTCPGGNDGTATITVAGGTAPYAIAWNTTPAQTAATATGLYAGNYTATVTDANGCVANAAFTITVPPAYTIAIATVPVSCNGLANGIATVTVSGGPVGPYTYSFDSGAATASNTGNGLLAGNHTVNIANANGCDTVIAFMITEPAPLTITASNQTNVNCSGGNDGAATVSVNGGTMPYNVTWNTLPVQAGMTANLLTAGNYTAQVTDGNGCTAAIPFVITEPAPLSIAFSTVPPSCFGLSNGAITANVAGGVSPYSYFWSNGSGGTSLYNVGAGSVDLTITDVNGCTITASENVYEPPQLTLTVNPDTIVCPGVAVTITAVASGGTGTYTYQWNPASGNTSSIVINPQTEQTVNCTVTDNNGCTVSDLADIEVFLLNPSDIQAFISNDSICLYDSTQINALYTGSDPTVQLEWTFCPSCPIQTTVNPTTNQTYTITATNQCNQQISDNVQIVVVMPPVVILDPTLASVCPNEYFSVQNNGTNDPDWDYFWDFGDGGTSTDQVGIHSYGSQGNYTVTLYVVNDFGCMSEDTASGQIIVNPQAEAQFTAESFVESTLDPEFTFVNQSINANMYEWHFGDGETSTLENPIHTYDGWGSFTVTLNANNQYNCPGQYQQVVEIKPEFTIFAPNAFTPDGDQHNQVFIVQGTGILDQGFEFEIYNRWGEMIFHTNEMGIGWDGSYKGIEQAQDGVYTWKVRFRDLADNKHEMNGHVSLLK